MPRSSGSDCRLENQRSSRNSDDVETVIIALGLSAHELLPGHTSASPKSVPRKPLIDSSSSAAARYGRGSSSSLQESPRYTAIAERLNATSKPQLHQNTENRSSGGVLPSPSFARVNSRAISGKALLVAEPPVTGGSFVDDDNEGKRTRGLSNLFEPKFGSRTSSKG